VDRCLAVVEGEQAVESAAPVSLRSLGVGWRSVMDCCRCRGCAGEIVLVCKKVLDIPCMLWLVRLAVLPGPDVVVAVDSVVSGLAKSSAWRTCDPVACECNLCQK
jgi:hypothetical protein